MSVEISIAKIDFRNLRPNVAFGEQTGEVAAPVATSPAKALLQELRIVLQSCLDLAFRVILHVYLVLVVDEPASDEIVIVSVELILIKPPLFVGESVRKVDVLENAGTVGTGATRNAGHATVHVAGSSTVEVTAFEVEGTEETIDTLAESWVLSPAKTLACNDAAIDLGLERRQDPLQQLDGPVDIIISKDDDLGPNFWNGTSHLASLVGLLDGHASHATLLACGHLGNRLLSFAQIIIDRNENEFIGFVEQDRLDSADQFFALTFESRKDHGHILVGQGGVLRNRNGLEGPERPEVDDEAEISVEARPRVRQQNIRQNVKTYKSSTKQHNQ